MAYDWKERRENFTRLLEKMTRDQLIMVAELAMVSERDIYTEFRGARSKECLIAVILKQDRYLGQEV